MIMTRFILIFLFVSLAFGQSHVGRDERDATYSASVVVFVVGNVLDVHSSWHKLEGNPLAPTDSRGRLSWEGAALKVGVVAGTLIVQRLIFHKRPRRKIVKRVATIANFSVGAFLTTVAVRNYKIKDCSGVER